MIKNTLLAFFLIQASAAFAGGWQNQASAFRAFAEQLETHEYPDMSQVYHFYCVATAMGDASSALAIGGLYLTGEGVEENPAIAKSWFRYALSLGHQDSVGMIDKLDYVDEQEDPYCPQYHPSQLLSKDEIITWVAIIAPTYGLDPAMVNALINVESAYNTGAISSQNAQGLMQLMPATAQRFGVQDILDPVQNLFGGIAYLRYLLDMYKGDLTKTWSAYNAGEGAVDKHHGIPPYEETIYYVRKLMGMYPRTFHPLHNHLPFVQLSLVGTTNP